MGNIERSVRKVTEGQFKNVIKLLRDQLNDLNNTREKMMFTAGRSSMYEIGYAISEFEKAIEVLVDFKEGYKCDNRGEFDKGDILWKEIDGNDIPCCPECKNEVTKFKHI